MAFSLKLAGESRGHRVPSRGALILGLQEYLKRYPRQLSRPAPARGRWARSSATTVFLFDEPLVQSRRKLRVAMRTEIKALHQRLKTTSSTSPRPDRGDDHGRQDRVMNAGRVEQTARRSSLRQPHQPVRRWFIARRR